MELREDGENFKIFDVAHKRFKKIMEAEGITHETITNSLQWQANFDELERNQAQTSSSEKNGGIYFETYDRRFIIQNVTKQELNAFLLMKEEYFDHLKTHPESLIRRIYGVFQIEVNGMAPLYFKFTDNIFYHVPKKAKFKHYELSGLKPQKSKTLIARLSKLI